MPGRSGTALSRLMTLWAIAALALPSPGAEPLAAHATAGAAEHPTAAGASPDRAASAELREDAALTERPSAPPAEGARRSPHAEKPAAALAAALPRPVRRSPSLRMWHRPVPPELVTALATICDEERSEELQGDSPRGGRDRGDGDRGNGGPGSDARAFIDAVFGAYREYAERLRSIDETHVATIARLGAGEEGLRRARMEAGRRESEVYARIGSVEEAAATKEAIEAEVRRIREEHYAEQKRLEASRFEADVEARAQLADALRELVGAWRGAAVTPCQQEMAERFARRAAVEALSDLAFLRGTFGGEDMRRMLDLTHELALQARGDGALAAALRALGVDPESPVLPLGADAAVVSAGARIDALIIELMDAILTDSLSQLRAHRRGERVPEIYGYPADDPEVGRIEAEAAATAIRMRSTLLEASASLLPRLAEIDPEAEREFRAVLRAWVAPRMTLPLWLEREPARSLRIAAPLGESALETAGASASPRALGAAAARPASHASIDGWLDAAPASFPGLSAESVAAAREALDGHRAELDAIRDQIYALAAARIAERAASAAPPSPDRGALARLTAARERFAQTAERALEAAAIRLDDEAARAVLRSEGEAILARELVVRRMRQPPGRSPATP
mgnify:CR=1 FL=1